MKSLKFTLLVLAILFNLNFESWAQQAQLYGLYYEFESFNDSLGTYQGNQYFVDINAQSASIENSIEIQNIEGVYVGSSTLDSRNAQYLFYGANGSGQLSLCKVDIYDGTAELIPVIDGTAKEMEFDLKTSQLYGLQYNGISDDFVSVDINTAEVSYISTLSNISATVLGTSCFDSNFNRYFIVGVTPPGVKKLFTINAINGDVLYEVAFSGNINELSYNLLNDKLIGLYRTANGNNAQLAEIDFTTGDVTVISDLSNNLSAFVVGSAVFEYQSQTYIVSGIDNNGTNRLFNIDATNGDIISDAEVTQNFIEFQADNVVFARTFYSQEGVDCSHLDIQPTIECNDLNNEVIITLPDGDYTYTIDGTTSTFSNTVSVSFSKEEPYFEVIVTDNETLCSQTYSGTIECTTTSIDLAYFIGRSENESNVLKWKTLSEFENDFFEIYRSKDGITFESIGKLNSYGNTSSPFNYEFVDKDLQESKYYYRLNVTDIFGKVEEYNVIEIDRHFNVDVFDISPNPSSDFINLNFTSNNIQALEVVIFNVVGQLVLQKNIKTSIGDNNKMIDISSLSGGTYILQLNNKEKSEQKTFIVH